MREGIVIKWLATVKASKPKFLKISLGKQIPRTTIGGKAEIFTMDTMAKAPKKKLPNRSESWTVYARVDPELKPAVEAYIASLDYPPEIGRVVERSLKEFLSRVGFWPPKQD